MYPRQVCHYVLMFDGSHYRQGTMLHILHPHCLSLGKIPYRIFMSKQFSPMASSSSDHMKISERDFPEKWFYRKLIHAYVMRFESITFYSIATLLSEWKSKQNRMWSRKMIWFWFFFQFSRKFILIDFRKVFAGREFNR